MAKSATLTPVDLEKMDSTSLLDALIEASGERGILMVSDAPLEELRNAQRTVDDIVQQLMRRLAW